MSKNEVAKVESNYPVLSLTQEQMSEFFVDNLDGQSISVADLDQIAIPSGGSKVWTVEGVSGVETTEELEGIIITKQTSRTYWHDDDAQGRPDCQSRGGRVGRVFKESTAPDSILNVIGGECKDCPMNQWESAKKGRGKACTEKLDCLMLIEGQLLPVLIKINTTSLKNASKYFVQLSSHMQPYYGVVTSLGLESNERGREKWNTVTFKRKRPLTEEEAAKVKAFRKVFGDNLQQGG